jgi:hypothetical protein
MYTRTGYVCISTVNNFGALHFNQTVSKIYSERKKLAILTLYNPNMEEKIRKDFLLKLNMLTYFLRGN